MLEIKRNTFNHILSIIYGIITSIRNWLFDIHILSSQSFDIPIISIGNLSVGGTGKTPHTQFVFRHLKNNYNIAVLSRGYKRKTKGFVLADHQSDASTIGDEPYQLFTNNPNLTVAVDENRARGIEKLMKLNPRIDAIILDDAFQHRHVNPGLNILLTEQSNLYSNDFIMPYGNLREHPKNSKRADVIIVTKCNDELSESEQKKIKEKLNIQEYQEIFYSTFNYENIYPVFDKEIEIPQLTKKTNVLLLTGIENPRPLYKYLNQIVGNIEHFSFPDHHLFTKKEIERVEKSFYKTEKEKLIITTEKDVARIKSMTELSDNFKENLFALPIEVQLLHNEQEIFIHKINDYVTENQRNS